MKIFGKYLVLLNLVEMTDICFCLGEELQKKRLYLQKSGYLLLPWMRLKQISQREEILESRVKRFCDLKARLFRQIENN